MRPALGIAKRDWRRLHRRTIDQNKPLLEIEAFKISSAAWPHWDFSLDVMPGLSSAIIGPNGSGKTTFFNLITGLVQPDGGKVLLAGEMSRVSCRM